ncbi:MAG: hypothetical protein A2511_15515 [Deltaproteobacteria bacterium RIFOXYD12_FULL_50_9]|nr:MAG: hypothetical protein A2511_15515 [Deltaproteobacteria bacterium RIFOXYD12_FULL_50_9]
MANILYISKYPPLEGGIAAKTYWLANALAGRGHTIHVVTDAYGIDEHYSIPNAGRAPDLPGVFVHRADQDVPWHIPNDSHRSISLLDKALEIVETTRPDLIVGGYLVPYGVVAFQLSRLTGIPLVLMHGGSDIHKFLLKNVWPNVIAKALGAAHCVVTDVDNRAHISRYTDQVKVLPPYVPDPSAFNPAKHQKKGRLALALVGKANYHWRHKGWQQVINIWSDLGGELELTVVSQGIGLKDFRNSVPQALRDRTVWRPFVPSWDMPALLHSFDGIFHLNGQLPFSMFSNLVLESLACGTPVITDTADLPSSYLKHGIDLGTATAAIFPISFDDSKTATTDLAEHLANQAGNASWDCASAFNRYISSIESLFLDTIEENS